MAIIAFERAEARQAEHELWQAYEAVRKAEQRLEMAQPVSHHARTARRIREEIAVELLALGHDIPDFR